MIFRWKKMGSFILGVILVLSGDVQGQTTEISIPDNSNPEAKKFVLSTSFGLCLAIDDNNYAKLNKCEEVSDIWFLNSNRNLQKGGPSENTKCLHRRGGTSTQFLEASSCTSAIQWKFLDDGKLCEKSSRTMGNNMLCLSATEGSSYYTTVGASLSLRSVGTGNEIWAFQDFSRRKNAPESTPWHIYIYYDDGHSNMEDLLYWPTQHTQTSLSVYWNAMPAYLKKHAFRSMPNLTTTMIPWSEVDNPPTISSTDSSKAMKQFRDWIIKDKNPAPNYPVYTERNIFIYAQWDSFTTSSEPTNSLYTGAGYGHLIHGIESAKFAVIALNDSNNHRSMAHEVGHAFHWADIFSPCQGIYGLMYTYVQPLGTNFRYGPSSCDNQNKVISTYYHMAYLDSSIPFHHNTHTIGLNIIYNQTKNALIIDSSGTYKYQIDHVIEASSGLIMLGAINNLIGFYDPMVQMDKEGGPIEYALFTIEKDDNEYILRPDGPIAYKFFSIQKKAATKRKFFFEYHFYER